jgi:hypothetical protein
LKKRKGSYLDNHPGEDGVKRLRSDVTRTVMGIIRAAYALVASEPPASDDRIWRLRFKRLERAVAADQKRRGRQAKK